MIGTSLLSINSYRQTNGYYHYCNSDHRSSRLASPAAALSVSIQPLHRPARSMCLVYPIIVFSCHDLMTSSATVLGVFKPMGEAWDAGKADAEQTAENSRNHLHGRPFLSDLYLGRLQTKWTLDPLRPLTNLIERCYNDLTRRGCRWCCRLWLGGDGRGRRL